MNRVLLKKRIVTQRVVNVSMKNIGDMLEGFQSYQNRSSKSNYDRRNPQNKYHRAADSADAFDFISLIASWEKIVGKKMAKNTLPLKVQGTTLTIITSHSIYNNQLSFFEKDIIKKTKNLYPNQFQNLKRLTFKASEYFLDMKNTQEARKVEFLNYQSSKSAKVEKKPEHQFDPDFLENYDKIQKEIKKDQVELDLDSDSLDALVRFNLKFKKPKSNNNS